MLQAKFFSCRLILRTSVHEKHFQIETAVLALKLDKERVHPSIEQKLTYLSNHEDNIQPQQILV